MTTLFVGQTPAQPALITILNPDGTPRDLTDMAVDGFLYSPAGEDVSAGSFTTINGDPTDGVVQFDWPVPSAFTVPGTYELQIHVTDPSDADVLDISTVLELEVASPPPPDMENARVTSTQVWNTTGASVTAGDILRAQSDVGLLVGFDLADDTAWDALYESDQRWLQLAVSHQSVKYATATTTGTDTLRPTGATAVRAGDVSITYGSPGTAEDALLAPLARMALSNLSWQGYRTIHPAPFLTYTSRPSVWTEV